MLARALGRLAERWNLAYYRRRVAHHARAMRGLGWRRKLAYLFDKARLVVDEVPLTGKAPDPVETVKAGYVETLRRYRPKSYRGAVDLIVSEHENVNPAAGWSDVASGRITVHVVPGDHESYIRDFVKGAALQLKVCLER